MKSGKQFDAKINLELSESDCLEIFDRFEKQPIILSPAKHRSCSDFSIKQKNSWFDSHVIPISMKTM